MNCALALRMLDAYIDDELDAATAAALGNHVESCAACAELRGHRVALRALLRTNALRAIAPPGLRRSIMAEIAASNHRESRSRSLRWWHVLVLGCSTAVMGALGGWWLAQPRLLESMPESAVARHIASLTPAGPRIDVTSPDRHVVRPWFQGRLDFAPTVHDLHAHGFELAGARLDRVGDRDAVSIVYRLRTHVINVFSWRASGSAADTASETTIRGFNIVSWRDRDLDFAAVSDTDSAELRRFVAAYRAP